MLERSYVVPALLFLFIMYRTQALVEEWEFVEIIERGLRILHEALCV